MNPTRTRIVLLALATAGPARLASAVDPPLLGFTVESSVQQRTLEERFDASVRIRHRAPDVPAEVTMVGRDRFVVETAEPVWAPAPGQAAVLYDGDECLGGGRIGRSAA